MKKAAIIGLGNISAVHLAALAEIPEVRLAAVCDVEESRRKAILPEVPFYTDYREMLRRVRPDTVHICLPHALHYQAALDAARCGCSIVAEKPLAVNEAEALAYTKLEQTYGIQIAVCLQNRLNVTSNMLFRLIQSGKYGKVKGVRGLMTWRRDKEYYEQSPWRKSKQLAGGGCLMTQAIHTLDLMQYLVGSPVLSVRSCIGNLLDYGLEVEDTAAASLRFQNGARGLFLASLANSEDVPASIDIRCEEASFSILNQTLYRTDTDPRASLATDSQVMIGKQCYGNSHHELIRRFYRALNGAQEEFPHPQDALPSMQLIRGIYESAASGTEAVI